MISRILILGGGLIKDFAFALLIGVLVGTYSSVFVASPVVIYMDAFFQRQNLWVARKLPLQLGARHSECALLSPPFCRHPGD